MYERALKRIYTIFVQSYFFNVFYKKSLNLLRSTLHQSQHISLIFYSNLRSTFWIISCDAGQRLRRFFCFYFINVRQTLSFRVPFHSRERKQVAEIKVGRIGGMGHSGHTVFGQKTAAQKEHCRREKTSPQNLQPLVSWPKLRWKFCKFNSMPHQVPPLLHQWSAVDLLEWLYEVSLHFRLLTSYVNATKPNATSYGDGGWKTDRQEVPFTLLQAKTQKTPSSPTSVRFLLGTPSRFTVVAQLDKRFKIKNSRTLDNFLILWSEFLQRTWFLFEKLYEPLNLF